MNKKYIDTLLTFKNNLDKIVKKQMDGEIKSYDIQITIAENTINIPFNADSYERLDNFIDEEIKESY